MNPYARTGTGKRQAGFSFIELMASAVILGVTVSGVMAMIGAGRDYELAKELRRQAGVIAHAAVEDTVFHHSKFSAIASLADQAVILNTTAANITGTLSVQVSQGSLELPRYSGGVVIVPYKDIQVKVAWTGIQADSVIFRKRVVKARP